MNRLLCLSLLVFSVCCGDEPQEAFRPEPPVASTLVVNGESIEKAYMFYDMNLSGNDIIYTNGSSNDSYIEVYLSPSSEDNIAEGVDFKWILNPWGRRNRIDLVDKTRDLYFNSLKDFGKASFSYDKDASTFNMVFKANVINRDTGEVFEVNGSQQGVINWTCFELIGNHPKNYADWRKNERCMKKYRFITE